ncbi:MAG: carboxypeptidase-like regulatory domain-containing protein [Erythrobacter sp.]
MRDVIVCFPKPCDEPWEAMAPRGCHRHCASCDKVVHDLAALSIDEAEALLDAPEEVCVRAQLGPDGVVALKPGGRGAARRMIAAAGASLALATAACQTVPEASTPLYRITGKFDWKGFYYDAELTSADGRKWRKQREPGTGRFIFDNLPPGVYTLTTRDSCGERVEVETVTISDASVEVAKGSPDSGCIIVGVMMRPERTERA